LARRSIDYGRAGLARRPHDVEFASELSFSYALTAADFWQLDRRDEALAVSAERLAFARKLSGNNPEVRTYRDAVTNALVVRCRFLRELGRIEEAMSSLRAAAEVLETMPDPNAGALATASYHRAQVARLLAGDSVAKDFNTWPKAARREADAAIADLRVAVARGFRRVDFLRQDPALKSLLSRDDVRPILAEMQRSAAPPTAPAKPTAAAPAPSPLSRPGQLEEDRLLGEVAIGLLVGDKGEPDEVRSRLEAILARIEARRKSPPGSPALESSALSIQVQISTLLDAAFPTDLFAR
jgi:hypothetical protein